FGPYAQPGAHRFLVGVAGGRVLGYATSSPYRTRPAYLTSVETSAYVTPDATGRGVGAVLYRALLDALAGEDVHRAYAGIALPNPASVKLHESLGYRRAGMFREQGRKFGRYWDVAWYEKEL